METAMRGRLRCFLSTIPDFSIPYICLMRYGIILLRPVRLPEKKDWGTIICSFQNSMALSFASVIQGLEEISGKKKDTVYMVGGGSRNVRLCQMTADATGKKVVTGARKARPWEIWAHSLSTLNLR